MRIGQIATLSGLSASAIRYYERAGLAPAPPRRGRNRDYGPVHLQRLLAIKAARAVGFGIADVRALLPLIERPPERRLALGARLDQLDSEIGRLSTQRTFLAVALDCPCRDIAACALMAEQA